MLLVQALLVPAATSQSPALNTHVMRGLHEGFSSQPRVTEPPASKSREHNTAVDQSPLQLHLFSDEVVESYGARCLDGSPSGYYYREGTAQDKDSFVIYLEGGGLCVEPVDCKSRAKGSLGSSTGWAQNWTDTSNVLSANASFNPFASWSHVYVPYGSGDVYIGTQRKKNFMGLYFAGHLTLDAIVDHLMNTTSLGSAKRVLLSGGSAGGIGTFQNADWLGSKLSPATQYRASPQAGAYFVNADLQLMAQVVPPISKFNASALTHIDTATVMADYLVALFGGEGHGKGGSAPFLDQSCMASMPPLKKHLCWSAAVHYPHVTTPMFIAQNRHDANQAGDIFGAEWWPLPLIGHAAAKASYLRYFGRQTVAGIGMLAVAKGDGLFMPSCYQHTGNLCMRGGSQVRNTSYASALASWFASDESAPHQLLDDCNERTGTDDPCNPFCSC